MNYFLISYFTSFFLYLGVAFQTLYYEPWAFAKSILLITKNSSKENFHYKGVNPTAIDPDLMDQPVIICLHGDQSYPATFIPLIDSLRTNFGDIPIFVPAMHYMTEKTSDPERRGDLHTLTRLMTRLQIEYEDANKPLQVIFIGHSMGGITACYYSYFHQEIDVLGILGISSRLSRLGNTNEPSLNPMLELIETKKNDEIPYFAIFGDSDWLVPQVALNRANKEDTFIAENQGHLGVLYDQDALNFISKTLSKIRR